MFSLGIFFIISSIISPPVPCEEIFFACKMLAFNLNFLPNNSTFFSLLLNFSTKYFPTVPSAQYEDIIKLEFSSSINSDKYLRMGPFVIIPEDEMIIVLVASMASNLSLFSKIDFIPKGIKFFFRIPI